MFECPREGSCGRQLDLRRFSSVLLECMAQLVDHSLPAGLWDVCWWHKQRALEGLKGAVPCGNMLCTYYHPGSAERFRSTPSRIPTPEAPTASTINRKFYSQGQILLLTLRPRSRGIQQGEDCVAIQWRKDTLFNLLSWLLTPTSRKSMTPKRRTLRWTMTPPCTHSGCLSYKLELEEGR